MKTTRTLTVSLTEDEVKDIIRNHVQNEFDFETPPEVEIVIGTRYLCGRDELGEEKYLQRVNVTGEMTAKWVD